MSVYAPLSRLCAMNPRIATACIARAVIPTAAWSMPVAAQNRRAVLRVPEVVLEGARHVDTAIGPNARGKLKPQ